MATISVDRHASPVPLVLLVDRDVDTRALYRHALTESGWQVDEADDGREGLAKAIVRHPSLVVTETRLSFIDGYTLCELLRRDHDTKDIGIVVLTADAYPSHVARARAVGADAVLLKPCLPEQLQAELRALIAYGAQVCERSAAVRMRASAQLARSAELLARRATLVRTHERFETTTPPLTPPALRCPSCDRPLEYERSNIGGVSERHSEQWDYYSCAAGCGTFQYRHRTRKVRRVS
jgi:CheY-like chemotaxis protein